MGFGVPPTQTRVGLCVGSSTWAGLAVAAAQVAVGPLAAAAPVGRHGAVALPDALLHTLATGDAARLPFQPAGEPAVHCNGSRDAAEHCRGLQLP